jgi:DNA (cytosine-5)-methyltransferase 1
MPNMKQTNMRIIDFFCGAGGFSEGFRQQGFNIIMGVDNWRPAVETHNLNHGLNDVPMDILDFEKGWEAIDERIPDTEIIIGSPPCVDFSMSNRAGKSYKGLGIRLIESYLRIVVVKKLKKNSILKAWLMENVPNSRNFVQETYSLRELDLIEWAKEEGVKIGVDEVVIRVKNNGDIFNAAEYGSPQGRKRFICGEIIDTGEFPTPIITHSKDGKENLARFVWLSDIRRSMPSPIDKSKRKSWSDPNYSDLKVKANELTDHFYDTGVYRVEWEKAKYLKTNHPFMGKMQFPEGEERTSRTVMATRSSSTREALIYPSEYNRKGDGEYRLPTIREAASLMGFPYHYQFTTSSEGSKWRLIGNAVCPHMASALAKEVRKKAFDLPPIINSEVSFTNLQGHHEKVNNLNDYKEATFDSMPKKNKGAKFRRQPFKSGNMTVALHNHDPRKGSNSKTNGKKWYVALYLGSGRTFQRVNITASVYKYVEKLTENKIPEGKKFKAEFEKKILPKVADARTMQEIFEANEYAHPSYTNPVKLVKDIGKLIDKYAPCDQIVDDVRLRGVTKKIFPACQILTIWALQQVVIKTKS